MLSDGGDVRISDTTITCNNATSGVEEDAGGGVLVLAENLGLINSLVQGNQASAPNGTAEDQVFFEGTIDNDGARRSATTRAFVPASPPPDPPAATGGSAAELHPADAPLARLQEPARQR